MRLFWWSVVLLTMTVLAASPARAAEVRPDHPRMLFTAEDLPGIRERCKTTHKDTWQELLAWMDRDLERALQDSWQTAIVGRNMGFVYQVTGEEKYARAGIRILKHSAAVHLGKLQRRELPAHNWLAVRFRRYNSMAYDWLYNAMTPQERQQIGRMILEVADLRAEQSEWNHAYAGGYNRYETEYYCGLALVKSGVDDAKAEEHLRSGFDFMLNQTIAGRNQVATDDGGIQSGMGYALYNYIPVEANFLATWKSATGEDLFERDQSLRYFPVWALYTITPNGDRAPICDSGAVDESRVSINPLRLYLSLIANRFGDGRAAWLMPEPAQYWVNEAVHDILWRDPSVKAVPPGPELPRGRHFEGLGWVAMRTGWQDPGATYSIFAVGDNYYGHKHRDVNSFIIYKKGYLAADARARVYQTSGHNTLLVFTGPDSDGEQRKPQTDNMYRVREMDPTCDTGDVVAFETNPHYVYACGDGTKAYNWLGEGDYVRDGRTYEPQLASFTRQYLFLLPNTFVVYDRTVSVKPDYRVVWQLHSWNEPEVGDDSIKVKHWDGQLTCRTILPENPVMKKQFQHLVGAEATTSDLWQTTVERSRPTREQEFLHVIHVGDASAQGAPQVTRVDGPDTVGVQVRADGFTYMVSFRRSGPVGGHVTVRRGATVLVDKDLTEEVQPQKGYAGAG